MDTNGIAALSTQMAATNVQSGLQVAVLKKSMEMDSQSALQLIQAIPQPQYNNPPNLGQNVDTKA